MPTQQQIRTEITEQIIHAIEKGCMPWKRPWRQSANSGRPTSVATGKPYQGINPLLLQLHADKFGFQSKWYSTYQGWQQLGGQVKARPKDVEPGCYAARAVLYRPFTTTEHRQGHRRGAGRAAFHAAGISRFSMPTRSKAATISRSWSPRASSRSNRTTNRQNN